MPGPPSRPRPQPKPQPFPSPPPPGVAFLFDLLPAALLFALLASGPGRLVVEFAAHLT